MILFVILWKYSVRASEPSLHRNLGKLTQQFIKQIQRKLSFIKAFRFVFKTVANAINNISSRQCLCSIRAPTSLKFGRIACGFIFCISINLINTKFNLSRLISTSEVLLTVLGVSALPSAVLGSSGTKTLSTMNQRLY